MTMNYEAVEGVDYNHDDDDGGYEAVDGDDDIDDDDNDGEYEAVDGVGIMGCCEVETVRVHFQKGINLYIFYGFRSLFSTKRDHRLYFL